MRGIQIKEYVKGPQDLKVTDLPDPVPNPDQYLIEIHATATNFYDLLQIRGKYQHQPPLPWVSGSEFSGTVISTPKSSSTPRYKPGDRVFGASQGGYATLVCVQEASLYPVPESWSFFEAAGLFVTAPTSYGALVTRANIKSGEYVLIHAAAGGVGLAAVQIAKAFGATVIATAGTSRKLEVAREFGADHVIDYSDASWPDKVKKLTPNNRGVDIVFDPVGLIDKSTKCIRWNGRLLVIGFAAGNIEKVAMNKVLLKNISIVGLHWGAYVQNEPEKIREVWDGIFNLIKEGKFRGTVFRDREFVGLEDVPKALESLGSRGTWGKVVVKVDQKGKAGRTLVSAYLATNSPYSSIQLSSFITCIYPFCNHVHRWSQVSTYPAVINIPYHTIPYHNTPNQRYLMITRSYSDALPFMMQINYHGGKEIQNEPTDRSIQYHSPSTSSY
ncbi:hypothetical protein EYC80_004338 [Monilinia laxa]|uniref:Enoyl reductase (ER) domain-containing protein n=1 Tax=Monilinia laxa TaxID=61186 RepID=A0A5N6KMJ4_MONLA|nr:hypothetical protein EYC80_004338 [Monilinia laxa]